MAKFYLMTARRQIYTIIFYPKQRYSFLQDYLTTFIFWKSCLLITLQSFFWLLSFLQQPYNIPKDFFHLRLQIFIFIHDSYYSYYLNHYFFLFFCKQSLKYPL